MKKTLFILILFTFFIPLFSQKIPENFTGIWEGKDRFVFFQDFSENQEPEIVILLKEYYGLWLDRTAEPKEWAEKEKRKRSQGTEKEAVHVYFGDNVELGKDSLEFQLVYSKLQKNLVPVYLYNDNIYLNFLIQDSQNPMFYKGNAVSKGFLVSEQSIPENIAGYVIDREKNYLFDIRYWKSEMDYSSENATFVWEDKEYSVPKHIISGGNLYSCVNGRAKKIRNVQKPFDYKKENYKFNDDESILILDEEPYLQKIADKKDFQDLMEIVKEGTSKVAPPPKPLFPVYDNEFHWEIVEMLMDDEHLRKYFNRRQIDIKPMGH